MDLIDPRFVAFVGGAAFLIVTPGPDMALVTRNALAGGGRAAAFTALGVGSGVLAWAAAAALGVAQVLDERLTPGRILWIPPVRARLAALGSTPSLYEP